MPIYFVTYGQAHNDAEGRSLGRAYSTIEAKDELEAHRAIAKIRGGKWSFLYHSAEAAGVSHYGLALVPLGPHREREELERAGAGDLEDNEPPL